MVEDDAPRKLLPLKFCANDRRVINDRSNMRPTLLVLPPLIISSLSLYTSSSLFLALF